MGNAVLKKIVADVQSAKYFSIILDCTPDASHQEQMTMIIRTINVGVTPEEIQECFVGFLPVESSTGQSLAEASLTKLEELELCLQNCRGQGYDNGSNMKGRNSRVQKCLLDLIPKTFYVLCGCHSLNLVLCDMAKSSKTTMTLFGILHQIYTLFGASTQRWQILKNLVRNFTVKPISDTRWEVKAV
ncbi:ZMYM1 protein, partial [Polypterus senegalus]